MQDVVVLEEGGSTSFKEVESVAEFGEEMESRGLAMWWKVGMGYQTQG
jgi:hypothetical protein